MSKENKQCPFGERQCGDSCGLFCIGMKACVFHGINQNLKSLVDKDGKGL